MVHGNLLREGTMALGISWVDGCFVTVDDTNYKKGLHFIILILIIKVRRRKVCEISLIILRFPVKGEGQVVYVFRDKGNVIINDKVKQNQEVDFLNVGEETITLENVFQVGDCL